MSLTRFSRLVPPAPLAVAAVTVAVAMTATAGADVASAAFLPPRSVEARFVMPATLRMHLASTPAITYDQRAVPVASWARVVEIANDLGGITVRLAVKGFAPGSHFTALVHVSRCGAQASAAGLPFMNAPSSGAYAANELPLAFRTSAAGAASAVIARSWGIAAHQRARSVVITTVGGVPAACVDVPFARLNPGW